MPGVACWQRDFAVKNEVPTMIDARGVAGTKRGSDLSESLSKD